MSSVLTSIKFYVFLSYLFASIFINYDGGAIPPILDLLEQDLGVPPAQQGALGAIVYLGLTFACPLAGPILQKYPLRLVLMLSFILTIGCCFLFALSPNTTFAFISRGCVGFTQSILVVYFPVWIDIQAPPAYATTWMSFVQASAPLGVMVGYCVSGYLAQVFHASWRLAFVVQGFLLVPPLLVVTFIPYKYMSILPEEEEEEENNNNNNSNNNNSTDDFENQKVLSQQKQQSKNEIEMKSPIFLGAKSDEPIPPSSPVMTGRARGHSAAMVFVQGMSQTGSGFQIPHLSEEIESRSPKSSPSIHPTSAPPRKSSTPGILLLGSTSLIEITDENGNIIKKELTFLSQLKTLIESRLFVLVVLGLSSLYFVVTCIQYWMTVYLIEIVHTPKVQVLTAFAVTALTAPTFGVISGGIFIDKIGGYQNTTRCLIVLMVFAVIAFGLSIPAGYILDFWTVIGLLWFVLFFGGSILAPATGIILRSVPQEVRPFASSMSMLMYTLLGYSAGPVITGLIYEYFGIIWCVRVGLFWGIFGFLFLFFALIYSIVTDRKVVKSASTIEVFVSSVPQ